MAIKIGIVNQKGGVAKTTTAVCLTDAFTQIGYKTLLVDFDPQANSSKVFGITSPERSIFDGILRDVPAKDLVLTGNDMGDILPSKTVDLETANKELVITKGGDYRLKRVIDQLNDDYEIIIVDSNPSQNIMMDNILASVDGIVIPMEPETFAIDGLQALARNVEEARHNLNPGLKIYGVLLTKYNEKTAIHRKVKEQFNELREVGFHTFDTIIRKSDAIPNTQSFIHITEAKTYADKQILSAQGSIYKYSKNNGAEDYSNFAQEIMEVISNG